MAPIILNGIGAFIDRADLWDRALIIQLAPITPTVRRTRADIDAAFAGAHAELLGAVLDVVSTGLRRRAEPLLAGAARDRHR